VQGDAGQLAALWSERFEAVTLVWTLHHVADPEAILREIHHILKPGGRVLFENAPPRGRRWRSGAAKALS